MIILKSLAIALALLFSSHSISSKPPSSVKREPFQLNMKIEGSFSEGKESWKLSVDGNGSAHLSIFDYPKPKIRTFKVSAKQLAQFRRILVEQKFFELGSEYGDSVPDSSSRTISFKQGKQHKSITLLFLRSTASNLSEIKRVLRVWNDASRWFKDADAMDMSSYDKAILDAK